MLDILSYHKNTYIATLRILDEKETLKILN